MDHEMWETLLGDHRSREDNSDLPAAEIFIEAWGSWSKPIAVRCSDGETYVLKGIRSDTAMMPRALVTEHVASRLGRLLGCTIPRVSLVELPLQFVVNEPQASHMLPGLCHGVEYVKGRCHDEKPPGSPGDVEARKAYAYLAVLYGWFFANDHQVFVSDLTGTVYSVDHGLFLPGGENWTPASLSGAVAPQLDPAFSSFLGPTDCDQAKSDLAKIKDDSIARVLGAVPVTWGVNDDYLAELGIYLASRRDLLIR
jgi:hypothetical protein